MKQVKQIIQDVIYISKITKTKNKKILTIISVVLSQITALTDISIIAIFSVLIAEQYTSLGFVNNILDFFVENKIMIIVLYFLIWYFTQHDVTLMEFQSPLALRMSGVKYDVTAMINGHSTVQSSSDTKTDGELMIFPSLFGTKSILSRNGVKAIDLFLRDKNMKADLKVMNSSPKLLNFLYTFRYDV